MVRVRPPGGLVPSEESSLTPASSEEGGEGKVLSAPTPRKRKLGKDEYQVEKIVGMRREADEVQYLIKWKGWGAKHNTWEPLSHLQNLQAEIAAFEAQAAT